MITLDVPNRSLHLEVSDAELAARLAKWQSRIVPPPSGYALLHHLHVQGADTGADLDFLNGGRGNPVGKDSH
jgi:dihydroxy-acid dehydratase